MIRIYSNNKIFCTGCAACFNICPEKAIRMVYDNEGFEYPEIDLLRCSGCNLCETVCPAIDDSKKIIVPRVYACQNKNYEELKLSSSGGVFSLFAKEILKNNGIVVGAAFDDKYVKHILIESYEEIDKLRRSKYVQSSIGTIYKQIKKYLNFGKKVLFSGTPCQVKGLKRYLKEEVVNLITIDVLCFGVASPNLFKDYLTEMEQKFGARIKNINFRAKELSLQAIKIIFDNGAFYLKNPQEDPFYAAFGSRLILRPSCYTCKYNNLYLEKNFLIDRSGSDISFGDYWGASTKFPIFNEQEGVSLVIIKTEKGQSLLNEIIHEINLSESDIAHAYQFNLPLKGDSSTNKWESSEFFKIYSRKKKSTIYLLNKYSKNTFLWKIKRNLNAKWLFHKIKLKVRKYRKIGC
jgi:coenzyme F420-reducing hydrogenase beta subunit